MELSLLIGVLHRKYLNQEHNTHFTVDEVNIPEDGCKMFNFILKINDANKIKCVMIIDFIKHFKLVYNFQYLDKNLKIIY